MRRSAGRFTGASQNARNPSNGVELPPLPRYQFKLIEPEDFMAFQHAAADHPLRAAFALMFSRGLRPGELTGIRRRDVEFRSRKLTIAHSLEWVRGEKGELGHFHLKGTKTADSTDVLDLTEGELNLLRNWQIQQKKDQLQARAHWCCPSPAQSAKPLFHQPKPIPNRDAQT